MNKKRAKKPTEDTVGTPRRGEDKKYSEEDIETLLMNNEYVASEFTVRGTSRKQNEQGPVKSKASMQTVYNIQLSNE